MQWDVRHGHNNHMKSFKVSWGWCLRLAKCRNLSMILKQINCKILLLSCWYSKWLEEWKLMIATHRNEQLPKGSLTFEDQTLILCTTTLISCIQLFRLDVIMWPQAHCPSHAHSFSRRCFHVSNPCALEGMQYHLSCYHFMGAVGRLERSRPLDTARPKSHFVSYSILSATLSVIERLSKRGGLNSCVAAEHDDAHASPWHVLDQLLLINTHDCSQWFSISRRFIASHCP